MTTTVALGVGNAVEVRGLSQAYGGIVALSGVTFSVEPGSVCCVLGPNGAGKTTLGRCLAGLIRTPPGSVSIGGQDLSQRGLHRRAKGGLVYLPEGGDVFPTLTVTENLVAGAASVGRRARRERIAAASEIFAFIGSRQRVLGGMLSGGEQQMLSLARILVQAPPVAVIDELSHGLAPTIVQTLFETLAGRKGGTTFVLIEQFLDRAFAIADQIVVLSQGRVAFDGSPAATSMEEVERMYQLDVVAS